jgi:hypothetical protein
MRNPAQKFFEISSREHYDFLDTNIVPQTVFGGLFVCLSLIFVRALFVGFRGTIMSLHSPSVTGPGNIDGSIGVLDTTGVHHVP